jgi:hypothetical protein
VLGGTDLDLEGLRWAPLGDDLSHLRYGLIGTTWPLSLEAWGKMDLCWMVDGYFHSHRPDFPQAQDCLSFPSVIRTTSSFLTENPVDLLVIDHSGCDVRRELNLGARGWTKWLNGEPKPVVIVEIWDNQAVPSVTGVLGRSHRKFMGALG